MVLTKDEFEQKCIDILEAIILTDKEITRITALDLANKMLEMAKSDKKYEGEVVDIYERVVVELQDASDEDFNALKEQLFC